jgi:hypothetical protein
MSRLGTVDLFVLASLGQLLLILKKRLFTYLKNYLSEEVNSTEPSPSVSVPCTNWPFLRAMMSFYWLSLILLAADEDLKIWFVDGTIALSRFHLFESVAS